MCTPTSTTAHQEEVVAHDESDMENVQDQALHSTSAEDDEVKSETTVSP